MKDLPHKVLIHKSQHHAAEAWCRENLGPRWVATQNHNGKWCCFWAGTKNYAGYFYYFADSQQAVLFALKWS